MYPIMLQQTRINQEVVPTVSARELHTFLGIGKDFSSWFKVQIERARLVIRRDFIQVNAPPPSGGAVGNRGLTKEYYLTLEAGKHIAMLSNSDKGFEVRDYFIECEKRVMQASPALPRTYAEALRQLAQEVEEKEQLLLENQQKQVLIESQQPKVEVYDDLIDSTGLITIDGAAKMLGRKPSQFRQYLRLASIIRKDKSGKGLPTASMMDRKYMVCKWRNWKSETDAGTSASVFFTNRGVAYIKERIARFQESNPGIFKLIFPGEGYVYK